MQDDEFDPDRDVVDGKNVYDSGKEVDPVEFYQHLKVARMARGGIDTSREVAGEISAQLESGTLSEPYREFLVQAFATLSKIPVDDDPRKVGGAVARALFFINKQGMSLGQLEGQEKRWPDDLDIYKKLCQAKKNDPQLTLENACADLAEEVRLKNTFLPDMEAETLQKRFYRFLQKENKKSPF